MMKTLEIILITTILIIMLPIFIVFLLLGMALTILFSVLNII